ncbi:MAG: glycosyltransferase [Nanoarchaeota archaeon]|nr:glycosyltransferase [Nanoarchaeota archaeon]
MMTAQEITIFVYNLTLIPIIFASVFFLLVSIVNIFIGEEEESHAKLKVLPYVSVQIPVFNDSIAERCVKACMEFDYPKDRYEIMIVDDSTDPLIASNLNEFAQKSNGLIRYFHRTNRKGFKPGALKEVMHKVRGEIIVIFDSDWVPRKNFLKKVVRPFADPKIAIVQTRQGFINKDTNLITRFASYLLMIYHSIFMPINNKINSVFFCGTAGAIRKSAMLDVGGWNTNSITEDSDLSVRLLLKGYKTKYLPMDTPSEVPWTMEAFIKQQMRWSYGNTRVFFDNAKNILFSRALSFKQRIMISFITLGNLTAPIVIIMTLFGFAGWFLGDPQLMKISDFAGFFTKFLFTAGFSIMGLITFYRLKILKEFPYLLLTGFTLSIVLAIANTVAVTKAALNFNSYWYCTPKTERAK